MKIEISNGRVIDPKHGVDRVASLYIAAGKVAAIGAAPAGWSADRDDRRAGHGRLPGADRSFGAAARAGLRIQGHARIRDAGGRGRRRDEPRLPAGHRSAARRAGPGRDAEAPRPLAQPGARLSDRRADRRPQGRRAHRNGRARRGGLRRVLAGRVAADRHAACCCARCNTPRPSATACGCARRTRISRKGGVAHDGEVATRLGLAGDSVGGGDHRAGDDLRAGPRHRRARAPLPALDRRRRGDGARGQARRPARDLRCRRPSPAPVRRRHRLVRRAMPADPAAARARATATRCARGSPTAPSTSCARTTRRSTTTASSCRSAKRSPARPGSSSCCRSRSSGRRRTGSRCRPRSPASRRSRRPFWASMPGTWASGAPADICIFDPDRALAGRARGAEEPGQEHALHRPRSARQGARDAGGRAGRPRRRSSGRRTPTGTSARSPAIPDGQVGTVIGPSARGPADRTRRWAAGR